MFEYYNVCVLKQYFLLCALLVCMAAQYLWNLSSLQYTDAQYTCCKKLLELQQVTLNVLSAHILRDNIFGRAGTVVQARRL